MTDQNDQQGPPAAIAAPVAPAPAPSVAQAVTTAATTAVDNSLKGLWNRYGIFFILVGLGLLILKFNGVIMDVLGWSSKKDLQEAQKTDTQLKAKEDATNTQADALIKQAQDLPKQEGQVDDDWDKK